MKRLVLIFVAALCLALAAGPAMAQHPKFVKKEKQHKKKKKKKKAARKQVERPSTFFAQAGTWTLGGEGTLRVDYLKGDVSGKKDWTGPLQFRVAPVVSYFVIDGLELRLGPTFRYERNLVKKAPDRFTLAGGAVFGGYYNHELSGTLFLTGGLDVELRGGKTKVENTNVEQKIFDWVVGPRLGITLAFGGRYGGFVRALGFFDYGGRGYTNEPGGVENDDSIMNFGVVTALGVFF